MAPTQQRFRAPDGTVRQPDLGLKIDLELVLRKGARRLLR
jgi:hypothetical protein